MGAWGTGPFDNDSALDLLGDLQHRFAKVDDDYDLIPGSADTASVAAELTATLTTFLEQGPTTATTDPTTDPDGAERALWDRYSAAGDAYTAVGLVAAALTVAAAVPSTGTTLFANLAGLASSDHPDRPGRTDTSSPTTHGTPAAAELDDVMEAGLTAHCGHVGLLDTTTAEQLRPLAAQAVALLPERTEWMSAWNHPGEVSDKLAALTRLLTAPAGPARTH